MRILIAPNPNDLPLCEWPAGARGHEVAHLANRPFPAEASTQGPAPNSWSDLLSRCPIGWTPDAYICWSFEYRPIPEGVEDADCLTVGVIGDWNLGGQAYRNAGGAFDVLVADRNGAERLRAAGFQNVVHWPLWAYDPQRHYPMPGVERDLDVAIIGNFNHHVQRDRAPWLARVARLSHRYRTLVACGIFGEEYTRVMNRAKIVFNRSIRGEINMRAYEAAACGALMFYERGNREIEALFRDREECVLYGDDDLEELIEYYLENEDERLRIAANGSRTVVEHTYSRQAAGLFDCLENLREEAVGTRPWRTWTPEQRAQGRLRQWLTIPQATQLTRAVQLAESLPASSLEETDALAMLACLFGELARDRNQTTDPAAATRHLQRAIDLSRCLLMSDPARASARINLGELLLASGQACQYPAAEAEMRAALQLLKGFQRPQDDIDESDRLRMSQVEGPYYPRSYEAYTVEMERLWTRDDVGEPAWKGDVAALLSWRCHSRLAELALWRDDPRSAVVHAREAASLQPDLGPTWLLLARCHREAGELAEAATAYKRAFELVPLDAEGWLETFSALATLRADSEARAFADDLLAIIDGCPNLEPYRIHILAGVTALESADNAPFASATLLAAPDWSDTASWHALLSEFACRFRSNPRATLELIAAPDEVSDIDALAAKIEVHLTGAEQLPESEWPDIHLVQQSLTERMTDLEAGPPDAVCPPPWGPGRLWLPEVPRMTIDTFHRILHERTARQSLAVVASSMAA